MVEPRVVARTEQQYVGITKVITMKTFDVVADRIPELFGWLGAHGLPATQAPFLRFNVIDMARELEVEAGVPIAAEVSAAAAEAAAAGEAAGAAGDAVFVGSLPAGDYVSATHVGHPDELVGVTAEVLSWAAGQGLTWDAWETPAGTAWGCRLTVTKTNPALEPDPNKWETELLFRLAD